MKQLAKYEIVEMIGEGATAHVYLARDTFLGRELALKVLKPSLVTDVSSFQRFAQEAQAAASLFNPHIATVLDMGEAEGRYFIAMRYIQGGSLSDIIKKEGTLTWDDTLRMAEQIGQALDYAHAQGFLHRDVKPSNILRTPQGEYVLTDFGLTRAMMSTGLTTHTGAVLGTPPYIAPEIWEGEEAVPATDQYALACVVAEALTGEVLFQGATPPAVMTAHMLKKPHFPEQWKEDVPQGIEDVLIKALSREPEKRFLSCNDYVLALKGLVFQDFQEKEIVESLPIISEKIPEKENKQINTLEKQKKEEFNHKAEKKRMASSSLDDSVNYDMEKDIPIDQQFPLNNPIANKIEDRKILSGKGKKKTKLFKTSIIFSVALLLLLVIGSIVIKSFTHPDKLEPNTTKVEFVVSSRLTETKSSMTNPSNLITETKIQLDQTPISTPTSIPIETATLELNGEFTDEHGVRMAWIPAGSFMMGDDEGEPEEMPAHEVWLDTYAIDVYEVTNELYLACVDEDVCQGQYYAYERAPLRYQYPVVFIDWFDAKTYCEWRGARLPTEAEWEKAARGGLDEMKYPWGDEYPNCTLGSTNGAAFWDCEKARYEVGQFSPNGYGLYDIVGNVWEWVADWYDENYYSNLIDMNPFGPANGALRVLRGGSGFSNREQLRVTFRYKYDPYSTYESHGFRCARSP
jgi:eukaryotic-like serine/threonine-protein kinase